MSISKGFAGAFQSQEAKRHGSSYLQAAVDKLSHSTLS
jgi:hypothetical protein